MTPETYQDDFFQHHRNASLKSAHEVVPIVSSVLKARSVIDIGCGIGTWLKAWESAGISDYMGIDGHYVNQEELLIPKQKFIPNDLETECHTLPALLNRKFDLVQSLEVAEHLHAENADRFINTITQLGDCVLFSAAIPGQEGTMHYNEQYPSYWVDKFRRKGYSVIDAFRSVIWSNRNISWWYRQNILLFVKDGSGNPDLSNLAAIRGTGQVPDLVHPELFDYKCNKLSQLEKNLRTPFHAVKYFGRKYLNAVLKPRNK